MQFTEHFDNRPLTPSDDVKSKDGEDTMEEEEKKRKEKEERKKFAKRNKNFNIDQHALLARENLRIKSIAKYKSLQDGDMQMLQDIENQMIDLASLKRQAFDDSSIEENEREIESELGHLGLLDLDNNFGRRSSNSELLESVRSSQDYWQRVDNLFTANENKKRDRSQRARQEMLLKRKDS